MFKIISLNRKQISPTSKIFRYISSLNENNTLQETNKQLLKTPEDIRKVINDNKLTDLEQYLSNPPSIEDFKTLNVSSHPKIKEIYLGYYKHTKHTVLMSPRGQEVYSKIINHFLSLSKVKKDKIRMIEESYKKLIMLKVTEFDSLDAKEKLGKALFRKNII